MADIEAEPFMPFPVSEQRIVDAEEALGRAFPPELRRRLMRENGGEISLEDDDWSLHPVWDPTDRKTMGRSASHIIAETATARSWESFPSDGVSLASNGTGDRPIVLGCADQIFLWEHETGKCLPVEADWL
ncbi:MAG: SMI1/KNR4 family protein [Sphingomonas sp.]|nr:SMI1/KNR4 family protein [Sphingomonas sp.]